MHLRPLALFAAAALACSHVGSEKGGKTAEEDFKTASDLFTDKDWPEAQKAFERVRSKYPYSKLAALAELRIADIKFEQEKFIESAEGYRQFVKLHPTHEQTDYAAYRVALSCWKDAPGQFFLFPPDYEKDQAQVRAAASASEDFLKKYPNSKYLPEVAKVREEAKGKLADHEWYVAAYYRRQDRWPGVAVRLEGLVRDYPGSKYEPEALLELADAYLRMGDRDRAQKALRQLLTKYPADPRRGEAERMLAKMG